VIDTLLVNSIPPPSNRFAIYRARHKSVNTPLSHERLIVRTWLAVYSGWGWSCTKCVTWVPGAYDKPFVG